MLPNAGLNKPGCCDWAARAGRVAFAAEEIRFALDSALEGAVHCELVSEVKIPAPVTKLGADSGRVMG
jgi:hypothetical protein